MGFLTQPCGSYRWKEHVNHVDEKDKFYRNSYVGGPITFAQC
jgi:hypothetical protein